MEDDLSAFRTRAAQIAGEAAPARFKIVVIPHRAGRIVPTDPERRAELEAHLAELANRFAITPQPDAVGPAVEAGAEDDPGVASDPAAADVCTACRGYCCHHGGSTLAFLDAEAIERFCKAHPDLGAEHVTAAYVDRIPVRHYENSCAYHAQTGCALPRSMRARICNEYQCRGLRDAESLRADNPSQALFVVARQDNRIMQGTFVDHRGYRPGPQRLSAACDPRSLDQTLAPASLPARD